MHKTAIKLCILFLFFAPFSFFRVKKSLADAGPSTGVSKTARWTSAGEEESLKRYVTEAMFHLEGQFFWALWLLLYVVFLCDK